MDPCFMMYLCPLLFRLQLLIRKRKEKGEKADTVTNKVKNPSNKIIFSIFRLNTRTLRDELILLQRDIRTIVQITVKTAVNNISKAMLNTCLLKTDSVWSWLIILWTYFNKT